MGVEAKRGQQRVDRPADEIVSSSRVKQRSSRAYGEGYPQAVLPGFLRIQNLQWRHCDQADSDHCAAALAEHLPPEPVQGRQKQRTPDGRWKSGRDPCITAEMEAQACREVVQRRVLRLALERPKCCRQSFARNRMLECQEFIPGHYAVAESCVGEVGSSEPRYPQCGMRLVVPEHLATEVREP